MQFFLGLELGEVVIAREDLVRAFAGQNHLDVPGRELGEEVVGDRAPYEPRIVALDDSHDIGQGSQGVLRCVETSMVLIPYPDDHAWMPVVTVLVVKPMEAETSPDPPWFAPR